MNKKLKIIILVSLIQPFNSCTINGNLKGLFSYYGKTKSTNPSLLINANAFSNICNQSNFDSPKIVIIDGLTLKDCLKKYKNAVVYIWKPKCRSKFCYSLNLLQQKCISQKLTLIVVAEYYDATIMSIHYNLEKPIFGIDTEYYKTNLTHKYLSLFLQDITNQKNISGRILKFSNGEFINAVDTL